MLFGNVTNRIDRLDTDARKRLDQLARIRGESSPDLARRLGIRRVKKIPKTILRHTAEVVRQQFTESGIKDKLAYVKLPNGRIFFGYPSGRMEKREFAFVQSVFNGAIGADTYRLAKDVTVRYLIDWAWYPRELLPGAGGRIVEVGAFIGHKTLRFADELVGPGGKILAIEVMPDNIDLLRHNVAANHMESVIDVVHVGVWHGKGRMQVRVAGRQRNTLVGLDHLKTRQTQVVPTDTLDNLLDTWDQPEIDLLVVTANGAEVEVLRGLDRRLNDVKVIYLAACYTVDGKPTYPICIDMLKDKGCLILAQTTEAEIYASPQRHAAQFIDRAPIGPARRGIK